MRVYVMFWDVNQTIYVMPVHLAYFQMFFGGSKLSRMEFEFGPIGESCHIPSAPEKRKIKLE